LEKASNKTVFDLKVTLPKPEDGAQEELLQQASILSQKVVAVLNSGEDFPKSSLHELFGLYNHLHTCVQAGAVLGFTFMSLGEYPAMRDTFKNLILEHGPHAPLLFYQALAEEKLNNKQKALDLLQQIIANGEKNLWVYLGAARLQHDLGDFSESISMANLAVYENEDESIEPFVILAKNFHAIDELSKMLECFSRIEKMKGKDALKDIGPLFLAFEKMYNNLKNIKL
jgi:tetratricopeptide (TPR) repeat protein